LIQALDEHFAHVEDADVCGLEGGARGWSIGDQEVRDADAVNDEGSAAFDAYTRAAEGLAHASESAGLIRQGDRQIFHEAGLFLQRNCARETRPVDACVRGTNVTPTRRTVDGQNGGAWVWIR
jgi:hypothetical protein